MTREHAHVLPSDRRQPSGPPRTAPACGNSSSWSIHVGHKPVPGTDPGEPRCSLDKRDLATRWNIGLVTLPGDIAHAMVPFQAQGAAQAIGDAAVLGDALAGATSPEVRDALDQNASRRLSTATSVQASCARAGEDRHLPEGLEARARNPRMAACAAVRSPAQMTRPAIADLPTADQTHLHHLPHLPRDFLPIRYRAAATRPGTGAWPEVTSMNSTPPCKSWPATPQAHGFRTSGRRREGTTHAPP